MTPPLKLATAAGGTYKGWTWASLTGAAGAAARGALGAFVLPGAASFPRPTAPLKLYAFEGCPFCQRVREAFSLLDLEYQHRPCPKGGRLWRPEAARLIEGVKGPGARPQFPVLVDGGQTILESADIVRHVFDKYGPGADKVPASLRSAALVGLGCGLSRVVRAGHGVHARPTKATAATKELRLYGYEPSPFVRLVREVLDELEIPYVSATAARGSVRRAELEAKYGSVQFPCLEDPNTGVAMYESDQIIKYLEATYGA